MKWFASEGGYTDPIACGIGLLILTGVGMVVMAAHNQLSTVRIVIAAILFVIATGWIIGGARAAQLK